MRLKHTFLLCLAILSLMPWAFAQNTTQLSGSVQDSTGGIVPEATVRLIDNATGREVTKKTDASGRFIFTDVSSGIYTVTVELSGFKKASVTGIKVDVGIPTSLKPIVLGVGGVAETVEVTASSGQSVIQTETTEIQTVVQDQQIKDLPINGRNAITLAGLQAGIATNSSIRASSVHGLRGPFVNLTWNGVNIQDNFIPTDSFFAVSTPSVDAVSEFSITTSNQGPADGFGAAQVKFTDTRGTKDYHGSLFWFHRNDALDANTFFNNANVDRLTGRAIAKPKLIRNQFGGRFGGPVPAFGLKEKLFFHLDYQGTREIAGSNRNRTVLTESARRGLFTYRQSNGRLNTVDMLAIARANPRRWAPDPRMQSLLALTPLPNDLTGGDRFNFAGFRFNSNQFQRVHEIGTRLDYDFSSSHKFEGSYRLLEFTNANDVFNDIGEPFPGRPGAGQKGPRHLAAFAWYWTLNPSITNQLRWGFQRTSPTFFTNEPFADGFIVGFPGLGPAALTNPIRTFQPQGRETNNYDLTEGLSWNSGKHLFTFGGNLRNVQAVPFNAAGVLPTYNLQFNTAGNPSPIALSNFPGISQQDFANAQAILATLIGSINNATQQFNVTSQTSGFVPRAVERRDFRYYALGLYGHDSYRLRSNLKLNYGLRWEYISPLVEKNGLALFPEQTPLLALFNPNAQLNFAGEGTPRPFYNKDLHNFAPNFGFAWDPFGKGKTSIRASYAISYVIDSNITAVRNAAAGNRGLQQTLNRTNIRGAVSGGGIQPISPPTFKVPRTQAENIPLDPGVALFTIEPNLKTPYVQQWVLSWQQEIFKDTALEFRYVGNHALKLTRGIDFTDMGDAISLPIEVCQTADCSSVATTTFLADFIRAQNNLRLCDARGPGCTTGGGFNSLIPGSQRLSMLDKFGSAGLLNNALVTGRIRNGEAGDLLGFYLSPNRAVFFNSAAEARGLLPGSFLLNPNAFATDMIQNASASVYHGFEAEIRRRWKGGLYLQGNYTWSKVLTDFEGGQFDLQPYLNLGIGRILERKRADFDVRHNFKANWVYELPFGPGKRFLDVGGPVGKILEGWHANGIMFWRSGRPFSITSARGTKNRALRSNKNTVILGSSANLDTVGLGADDTSGRPNLFSTTCIGRDGRAAASCYANPGPGQLGTLGLTPVSGPNFFNLDMSFFKRTRIPQLGERGNFEFRVDFFNFLNNTNFSLPRLGVAGLDRPEVAQNINSTTFGRINNSFDPRILQFSLRLSF